MSDITLFAAEVAIYLFAFGLTFVSGYLVYRQRLTSFQIVRQFILGVYCLIVVLMALDFLRILLVGGSGLMKVYPVLSITVGLAQAVLLLAAGIAVYLEPAGSRLQSFPLILPKARLHMVTFAIFLAISVVAVLYTAVVMPVDILKAVDLAGRTVPAMGVSHDSISLILVLLGFFLGYPVLLLILAARRIKKIPTFSRSLTFLALGWAAVSTMYVVIESYLWLDGVDATAILYSFNAVVFFLVTREFRNSAVLDGMIERLPNQTTKMPGVPRSAFSVRAGHQTGFLRGTISLFEANPTASYEITLRQIASELSSMKDSIFVITSKGSRVYKALSDIEQVKLFVMTTNVNHVVPTENSAEVLIPPNDPPMLLDIIDKAVNSATSESTVVMLDSLSDLILDIGFRETYKFVKQTLEICSSRPATFVAIMFQNAHDLPVQNAIRSLFSNHFVEDSGIGPRVSKFLDGIPIPTNKGKLRDTDEL